jgi:hypothetical protein
VTLSAVPPRPAENVNVVVATAEAFATPSACDAEVSPVTVRPPAAVASLVNEVTPEELLSAKVTRFAADRFETDTFSTPRRIGVTVVAAAGLKYAVRESVPAPPSTTSPVSRPLAAPEIRSFPSVPVI